MLEIFTCTFLITCVTSFSTNVSCFSALGSSEYKDTNANVCHPSPWTSKVSLNDLLHLFLLLSVWSPRCAGVPSAETPAAVALPSPRRTLYLREETREACYQSKLAGSHACRDLLWRLAVKSVSHFTKLFTLYCPHSRKLVLQQKRQKRYIKHVAHSSYKKSTYE